MRTGKGWRVTCEACTVDPDSAAERGGRADWVELWPHRVRSGRRLPVYHRQLSAHLGPPCAVGASPKPDMPPERPMAGLGGQQI